MVFLYNIIQEIDDRNDLPTTTKNLIFVLLYVTLVHDNVLVMLQFFIISMLEGIKDHFERIML